MGIKYRVRLMDLRRIRYFLELCDTLNFSMSARSLGISQPALTKAILRLEEELGGKLIRREGKHTHLTPLGKAMEVQFEELDASAKRAKETALKLVTGTVSQIQIAIMCTIGPQRVTNFLSVYRQLNPDVEIVLHDATPPQIIDKLLGGNVDCALVGTHINNEKGVRYISLYEESMVVLHAKNHPFTKLNAVSLDDVMREPYLDRLMGAFPETVGRRKQHQALKMDNEFLSDRDEWTQALVREGFGVSIVPEELPLQSGLATTQLNNNTLSRRISLAVPSGREDNPAVRSFMHSAETFAW